MQVRRSIRHTSQMWQHPLMYNSQDHQVMQRKQQFTIFTNIKLLFSALTLYCFVLCCDIPYAAAHIDETISVQEGKMVVLPCPVNKKTCGDLHSINWFKGDHRIAVYLSDESNSTNVSEDYEDRVSVTVEPYQLIIRDLKIEDEDIFMCDTTYFVPAETCDNFNGYRIELNVLVPPSEVVVLDEKGDRMENESIIGPLQERQILKASCVVRNTRPQPQVGWWRGDKRLTTHSPSFDEIGGLFTATLELIHKLTRDDLANDIECRTESSAIPNPIKYHFSVDLQVRPTSISVNGVEHHTVQGSRVVLTCDVHGARPPVNLTWYNSTTYLPTFLPNINGATNVVNISPIENDLTEIRTKAFENADGTYHTQSELIFNATRFENDKVFRCDADNIVLQLNREKPFTSSLTLEVLYPPVVKVTPPKIVVNTSDTVLLNCEYVANPASLTHVMWFRNGEMVNANDTNRYEGGSSENVALVIRSTKKNDSGNYTCQLSNVIGKGVSEHELSLDVQYVPNVEVLMMPHGPVKEDDESNVTLYCNIIDANPALLTRVRWYANSSLLKELPDCDETREDLCHVDPSKLLLESIGRGFFYNYSCEGYNVAGWGPRSKEKELVVYYEPGPATLTYFPLVAIKKKSVTFTCHVEEPGYPEPNRFRWMRGGRGPLQDIVTRDWTIEPVGLDSRTNYSCYAFNEGGKGGMATVNLDIHAPPFFIRNLPQYTGFYHSVTSANLTCRIECVPRCEITWLKDGSPIDINDARFSIKEKYLDASPATGDFESMLSVLHFNMSNWKNGRFDILKDNYNFTCSSTANSVGPGIKSTTCVSIEHAPENTTVSDDIVYVQENNIPGRVICKSKAIPEPKFEWFFNNKSIILSNALIMNTPMTRNDSGIYTCVAKNRHGVSTAETYIDVQFEPRCTLERQRLEGQDTLICTAFGNPVEASFSWSIKMDNDSTEILGEGDSLNTKDKSFYTLENDYAIARTYRCVANNTVGEGPPCEIEVAEQLAWWNHWDKTTLIILVAVILLLLLAVIVICCIIICVCRRRRRQEKYDTDVSINTLQSVFSRQSHALATAPTTPTASCSRSVSCRNTIIPHLDLHQNLWAATNVSRESDESLTAPQLLHASEPKATAPPAPAPAPSLPPSTSMSDNTITISESTLLRQKPLTVIQQQPQVPKSPPRWPLCPGVMVHVSSDTKENLSANRMTLKRPSNNTSTGSETSTTQDQLFVGLFPNSRPERSSINLEDLELEKTTKDCKHDDIKIEKRVEQFFVNLFRRAKGKVSNDSTRDSQRSHVGLLGDILRRRQTPIKQESEFTAEHRLKGICCSGSVTYKKSHSTLTRSPNSSTSITHVRATTTTSASGTIGKEKTTANPCTLNPAKNNNSCLFNNNHSSVLHETATTSSSSIAVQRSELCSNYKRNRNIINSQRSLAFVICPTSSNNPLSTTTATITTTITQSRDKTLMSRTPTAPTASHNKIPTQCSILKSQSPPVKPPRPPLQPRALLTPLRCRNLGSLQIQKKSSTMGDLLTEPGEYENLPFHGLQTAPNKSNFTMPTDFTNDISHVVLVAPLPKRFTNDGQILHDNNTSNMKQRTFRDEDFNGIEPCYHLLNSERPHHYQQQILHNQQQQLSKNQIRMHKQQQNGQQRQGQPFLTKSSSVGYNDNLGIPNSTSNRMVVDAIDANKNCHRIRTGNSNNFYSKSYTDYYQRQQKPVQQQKQHTQQQEYKNGNVSGLPSHAVIDRPQQKRQHRIIRTSSLSKLNDLFLPLSNFKKFDTDNKFDYDGYVHAGNISKHECNEERIPIANQMRTHSGTHNITENASTIEKTNLKCKRHHSFTAGSVIPFGHTSYDNMVDAASLNRHVNCIRLTQQTLAAHNNDQESEHSESDVLPKQTNRTPFYENLNDSVQIYECTADTHEQPHGSCDEKNVRNSPIVDNHYNAHLNQRQSCTSLSSVSRDPFHGMSNSLDSTTTTTSVLSHGQPNVIVRRNNSCTNTRRGFQKPQHKHHQRHHKQKDDSKCNNGMVNVMEAERLSIYRSDSGISNGSYECFPPIAGMLGMSCALIGITPLPLNAVHKTPQPSAKTKTKLSTSYEVDIDGNKDISRSFDKHLELPYHLAHILTNQPKCLPRLQSTGPQYLTQTDDSSQNYQRDLSSAHTLDNLSYGTASSSQIDSTSDRISNTTGTDPISLSCGHRSMSQSESGTLLTNIMEIRRRHQRPSEINSLEDFEQSKLGHNYDFQTLECRQKFGYEPYNEQSTNKMKLKLSVKKPIRPPSTENYEDRLSVTQWPIHGTSLSTSNNHSTATINTTTKAKTIAATTSSAFQNLVRTRWQQQQQQQQQQPNQTQQQDVQHSLMINNKRNVNSSSASDFSKLAHNLKASPFMMMMLQKTNKSPASTKLTVSMQPKPTMNSQNNMKRTLA